MPGRGESFQLDVALRGLALRFEDGQRCLLCGERGGEFALVALPGLDLGGFERGGEGVGTELGLAAVELGRLAAHGLIEPVEGVVFAPVFEKVFLTPPRAPAPDEGAAFGEVHGDGFAVDEGEGVRGKLGERPVVVGKLVVTEAGDIEAFHLGEEGRRAAFAIKDQGAAGRPLVGSHSPRRPRWWWQRKTVNSPGSTGRVTTKKGRPSSALVQ